MWHLPRYLSLNYAGYTLFNLLLKSNKQLCPWLIYIRKKRIVNKWNAPSD